MIGLKPGLPSTKHPPELLCVVGIISPLYRWEDLRPRTVNDWPTVTELMGDRVVILTIMIIIEIIEN